MALQTDTTIKIGETIIRNFTRLKVNQKIHDHHTFSFEIRTDILVEEFKSVMPVTQKLEGEKISIEIKPIPDLDDLMIITNPKDYIMQFYGIVTKVRIRKSRILDSEETMVISGYSSSIMLENGPETNSFTQMPLADIVSRVKSGYELDMEILPFYKDILAYTVQYNQSDFNFLNRLAKRYGQWFYYTGRTIIFGDAGGHGPEVSLTYGINMHDFTYDLKVKPALFKIIENDNRSGTPVSDNTLNYRKEIDGFHQNFINKSNQVFSKETVIQLNQNSAGASGRNTAQQYTKNKMRAVMGGLMQIKGTSEVPGITLGNNVRITGVDVQLDSTYKVTQITHNCDDGGDYVNQFTAVNFSGSVFSPKTNPDLIPHCQSQSAIVMANDDPDGLSGVKVQMPWQEIKGETTPYIPLLQKYGGEARGSHIIPEVGDTVYVEFQGGNAEMPIVTGTLTSKKEKSGYSTPNNDLKVFRTRSGIMIVYNDADGSILIEDPSGNKYFMDGKGNIKLLAPKNIEIEAGDNIVLKAGKDIKIDAKQDIEIDAGNDIFQKAQHDVYIGANGNIMEQSDNRTEMVEKDFSRTADVSNEIAAEASLYSHQEDMKIQSGKQILINSAEKSNLF